ncbi:CD109 antigen-like [Mya arenaria]|uniref:CD109 antigen-like n=1 Tax=Mya arenaria TaxID=6604 RepID=UPI0022E1288F|nr:CD109 antigen-like [Mya arenaria]
MVRDTMVAAVKPVPCTVYEYYEPSNQMTVFYVPLKAKNSNICDVCGIECGCFPENLKTGSYSGSLTVTKDGIRVGSTYFHVLVEGDSEDRQYPLVQTDKGIYKAGQTVHFRILVINEQRRVVQDTFTIDIFDADSNRVRRWANVTDSSGVYVGKMEMSNYPVLGEWTILVSNEKYSQTTKFDVEEFELPKFDVELDFPKQVATASDDSLKGKVSALYTFGTGVSGDLELTLKYSIYSVVKHFKVKDGSVDIDLPFRELASDFRKSYVARRIFNASNGYYNSVLRLEIHANVVEDVTGVNMSAESYLNVKVYDVAFQPTFKKKFHVGQDIDISGEVTSYIGDPYPGVASADIDLWVEVKLYLINRSWVVIRKFARIDIDKDNKISYTVEGEDLQLNVSYIYMKVVSNGWYIDEGEWFDLSEGQAKEFTVKATKEMRPNFVVMAWSLRAVQTRISFDKKEVRPGDDANIHLQGNAGSNFYLLTVDKSILILDQGNDITEEILPLADNMKKATTLDDSSFYNILRSVWLNYHGISLREGTVLPTSTTTRQPENKGKQVTLRKKFPDTWLFNNVSSGETGIAEFTATAPDTITTWVATCFAIDGKSRLSVAVTRAELRVFLPFFVSVQLPFSVIRNEQVVIQANVFNYHKEDLYILVTLKQSGSFRGLAVSKRGKSLKLKEKCGNIVMCILARSGRATPAFFPIVPLEIGDIKLKITVDSKVAKDTVVKKLRVEPEGMEQSVAYPVLIDLTQTNTFDYSFHLAYPPNVVEGSERMQLTLNGDIMGPTIDNLDRLVTQPYGCGEQNMISTAPSVFVIEYLTAVGRSDADLEKLTESYIRIGIQREMNYKHPDWSFSAWGGSGSGSSWLTSFVLKVFSMATFYVDVEDRIITLPSAYLLSIQNDDGSFPERGNVIHREMQGGSHGSVERMTAYVLIALMEAREAGEDTIQFDTDQKRKLVTGISNGLRYLEGKLETIKSDFTLAITTNALGLGKSGKASVALQMLKSRAKSLGGNDMLYWEETAPVPSKYHFGPSTTAVSIEMTAYALLALSKADDKVDGARVNKWLIGQRSPYGGFISSQDTVIGLEALAAFGALMKSPPADMTIWVSKAERKNKLKFRITPENEMVLQTAALSADTSVLKVQAIGHSKAIITVSLFYNIFMDLEDQDLRLEVDVVKESVNGFTVRSCISWLEDDISGMVVAEIGIPSGFKAYRYGIAGHELLMRSEIEEKKVVLYFDEITQAKVCVDINMVRDTMVASVKKVPCKVYEYYEPSNEMTVFYAPLSAKNSNICDVCGIQCGCVGGNDNTIMPIHNSGFDSAALKWMLAEAEQNKLPEDGYKGGLVFDEMAIPTDIQITVIELDGFVDVDEEANACERLRKGKQQKALGPHIL